MFCDCWLRHWTDVQHVYNFCTEHVLMSLLDKEATSSYHTDGLRQASVSVRQSHYVEQHDIACVPQK